MRPTGRHIGAGKKVLVLVGSLTLTLIAIELAFRILGFESLSAVYSKPELFWRHDTVLGWSLQPGAKDTYRGPRPFPTEFSTPVEINSLGLRGPEITPVPPGGLRVLLLGDSMVAGFEVPDAQHFRALLEQKLTSKLGTPIQVLNAGVRGYGTDQTWLYYTERGHRLNPDVVLFVHMSNDPEDNTTLHRPRRPFGKAAFALQTDGSLKLVGSPIPHYSYCASYRVGDDGSAHREDGIGARLLCWLQTGLSDHSAFFTFSAQRLNTVAVNNLINASGGLPGVAANSVTVDAATRVTAKLVNALADSVTRSGAEFLMVAWSYEWEKLRRATVGVSPQRMVLMDKVYEGVPELEIRFKNDSHFNARGHQRFAAVLEGPLEEALRAKPKAAVGPDNQPSRSQ